jgi:hypothetical protein
MPNTKQTRHVIPASSETLLHMLEMLPDALFVVDNVHYLTKILPYVAEVIPSIRSSFVPKNHRGAFALSLQPKNSMTRIWARW